jgi:hypothetical protein
MGFCFFKKSPFVSNLTSGARKKAGGFWVAVRINKAQSPSELALMESAELGCN